MHEGGLPVTGPYASYGEPWTARPVFPPLDVSMQMWSSSTPAFSSPYLTVATLLGLIPLLLQDSCLVAKLCQTLCIAMDCSLPGSSVHGIL